MKASKLRQRVLQDKAAHRSGDPGEGGAGRDQYLEAAAVRLAVARALAVSYTAS